MRHVQRRHLNTDARNPGTTQGPALRGEIMGDYRSERLKAAERRIEAMSHVLDDLVEIPGTGRRIGVDPVLGLVPVVGDAVSALASIWVIAEAARFRLPPIVLARMILNAVVDLVIGAIPVVGDLFDFVSKANSRNLALFRRHATDPNASTADQKAFFAGLVLLVVGLVWLLAQLVGWLLSIEIAVPSL